MSTFRPVRNLRHMRHLLDRALEEDYIPEFTPEDADEVYELAQAKGLPNPESYSGMHLSLQTGDDLQLAEVCSQLVLVDAYERGRIDPETFVLLAETLCEETDRFLDEEVVGLASFPTFISVPTYGNA